MIDSYQKYREIVKKKKKKTKQFSNKISQMTTENGYSEAVCSSRIILNLAQLLCCDSKVVMVLFTLSDTPLWGCTALQLFNLPWRQWMRYICSVHGILCDCVHTLSCLFQSECIIPNWQHFGRAAPARGRHRSPIKTAFTANSSKALILPVCLRAWLHPRPSESS